MPEDGTRVRSVEGEEGAGSGYGLEVERTGQGLLKAWLLERSTEQTHTQMSTVYCIILM